MKTRSPHPWRFDMRISEDVAIIDWEGNDVCQFSKMPSVKDLSVIRSSPELLELVVEMAEMFCPKKDWEGTAIRKKIDSVLKFALGDEYE